MLESLILHEGILTLGIERRRIVINRLMQLVVVLQGARTGLTVRRLTEKLERSKSTIHRDLTSLRAMGVPIEAETVSGEVRYRLTHWPLVAIAPTPLQLATLCLAREALDHLEGTTAVRELDDLLAKWGRFPKAQLTLGLHRRTKGNGAVVGTLDGAIAKGRRIEIAYRGEKDAKTKLRKVEPIALRASGEQLYLWGYDVDRQDYRTFKTTRMQKVLLLSEPSNDHTHVNLEGKFAHSARIWTAESPTTVVVRISAEKARFVREYPLMPHQRLKALDDGSVEVSAEVNGTTEALNWVLSWGANAEAISPPELREKAAEQVRGAAERYDDATAANARLRKTTDNGRRAAAIAQRRDQVVSRELGRGGRRVEG